jgi:hypothetical protein
VPSWQAIGWNIQLPHTEYRHHLFSDFGKVMCDFNTLYENAQCRNNNSGGAWLTTEL